jgi:hypothetical protein
MFLLYIFLSQGVFAIEFDGQEYKKFFSTQKENAKIIEFTPLAEDTKNWKEMITYRCHSNATELKQVIGPYYKARSKLVLMKPEASKNESSYIEDVNLVLFLGSPKTEYIEFVVARFIRPNDTSVFAAIYSHREPSSKNVDVSTIMKNKESWINQLKIIKTEDVKKVCDSVPLNA